MIYISNRLSSYYLRIILIFLIFSFKATLAQETGLDQKVTTIQELLSSVEANKLTFNQEFKTVSPGYYDYTISELNSKGNEESTTYSFALADIDKNSVRYFTKKDVILVELAVKGKQKLIKKLSDEGGKIAYITSFTMYGLNADNGRDLESAIENSIPEAIEVNKNLLVLDSYEDHLQWLEKNIGNVDLPKHQITQQLSKDLEKSGVVALNQTVDSKNERFEFNLSLLNPNSVNYKISGDEFLIEVGSAKGVSGIKFYSDEVLKGYTDKVFFYANSLANGKNIYKVLKEIIPLATTEFDASKPDFNTVNSALDYLNNHIDDIQSDGRTTAQKLTLEDYMATFSLKETISDKNEEHLYSFNLTDINQNKISFNDKKTRFYLVLNTNKEEKYIGHSFNGETENYEKEILLYFNSYDEAYVSKEALQFLVVHFKDQITETNESFEIGLEDALSQLSSEIKPVQADNLRYEQEIELLETETSTFKFTQTESSDKKTTEYVYEFSAKDLSQKSSKVIVSGKRVWAEIGVKSEQKLVKVYKDGQVQNYENKIEIEALNPENAKEIVAILKRLAASKSKL
ncbi:hypothetical protein [Zobellia nedashkovskayae]|uniref:hypothetical protein n=1 Tax=Zobellia nedashkovskayae TaxID=2779510 RepID=UPI00188D89A3|nr:hypothetical protein [Zobellia nedashkovskayae]